jgi:hypothetical protein
MMRFVRVIGLAAGLGITASAGTVYSYTDTINDGSFATASYSLTANNAKVITSSSFSDGSSTLSGAETADTPNMREPGSGNLDVVTGSTLHSAEYDLNYLFSLAFKRSVTDNGGGGGGDGDVGGGPFRAQTNPVFDAVNDGFAATLVFIDSSTSTTLAKVDVTNLATPLDLMPYLMNGGAIQAAFEAGDLFLRTRLRADDVVFKADLTGYDSANNPDRNVTIDYDVREKLTANSSVTLEFVPEPASFGLLSLGMAGLIALSRKLRT